MTNDTALSIFRQTLGAVYAAVEVGFCLLVYSSPDKAAWGALTAAVVGGLLARYLVFRWILRVIASIQAGIMILTYRIFLHSLRGDPGLDLFLYILLGIGLPLTVAVFICTERREEPSTDLPPGYQYLKRHSKPLPAWAKVLMILGVCVGMVAQMFSSLLFLMIFLIPIGLAVGWLISLLKKKKGATPTVARRVRLKPQLQKPSQTRSQYTIDSSEYEDPDTYKQ